MIDHYQAPAWFFELIPAVVLTRKRKKSEKIKKKTSLLLGLSGRTYVSFFRLAADFGRYGLDP